MMKNFLTVVIGVILIGAVVSLGMIAKNQKERIRFQERQIENLQANLKKAIDKTAISFSINPAISNKVNSAFGSTKNVTLQYYFTLDGKAMLIDKPDSVYNVVKEYFNE